MIDLRTVLVVILTLAFADVGLGRTLPFDSAHLIHLVSEVALFGSYLYLMRTLLRLPVAVVITFRRTRYARQQYKLNTLESLRDGYTRGFLDARRWSVEPLAIFDRMIVCCATLLITTRGLGTLLLTLGGFMGMALLVVLYLMRGTFGWLVADKLDSPIQGSLHLPFIKGRD